jgi:uncharacterized protein involved in cysteine biosynthesis
LQWLPLPGLWYGIWGFLKGLQWLTTNLRYLFLLMIPTIIGFVVFGFMAGTIFTQSSEWLPWLMPALPETWYGALGHYVLKGLYYLAFFGIAIGSALLFTAVLAVPVSEYVSLAVERSILGHKPPEISLWETVKLMGEELKKALCILLVSVLILITPGVNVLTPIVTAFLVGWSLYDFPLARRGWTFRRRLSFVLADFWLVTGFGLILIIPFAQLVLYPLGIVGGTILSVERLQKLEKSV